MTSNPPGIPDPAPWTSALFRDPARFAALQSGYLTKQAQLWSSLLGQSGAGEFQVAPEPGDRRFAAADWRDNPYYAYLKQSYLLAARFLTDLAESADLEARSKDRLRVAVRQWWDAMWRSRFARARPPRLK